MQKERCVEMRENRAKHKLERGETVVCLSGNNSTDMIDQLGPLGFDAIWLEGEHGPVDFGDIPDLTRACDLWGMTSVVRVNQNNEGIIYRTFDLGAQGLVVPMSIRSKRPRRWSTRPSSILPAGGACTRAARDTASRTMYTGPTTRRWSLS